jgi:hypothetical protein
VDGAEPGTAGPIARRIPETASAEVRAAAEFLDRELKNGSLTRRELEARAELEGIRRRAVRRAADCAAGVIYKRRLSFSPGHILWGLSSAELSDPGGKWNN